MNTGNRVREIYNFFTTKTQSRLRKDYLNHFGFHEQTFRNKYNLKSHHEFTGEELLWFENWARENGMPSKGESQINQIPAV